MRTGAPSRMDRMLGASTQFLRSVLTIEKLSHMIERTRPMLATSYPLSTRRTGNLKR